MRAGVVHQDQAIGIDLGKKMPDFGLTKFEQRVAKQHVDGPRNARLQTGFAAEVDKFLQAGGLNLLFGLGKDFFVWLAGNDLAGAVLLQPLSHIDGAHGEKRPGLNHQVGFYGGHQALQKIQDFNFGGHGVKHPPALGVGTFRRGAMVFRLGFLVAMLHHVVQDFVYRIYLAKSTPRNDQQDHSGKDGQQRGQLRVAHAPQNPGIDADELHQEALNAEQDQKFAGDHAGTKRMLYGARAAAPYVPINEHAGQEFIDRRGM